MKTRLHDIYYTLYDYFGPQHWWPGETLLEVMVGAILTQNTNWGNVKKAIAVLKEKDVLVAQKLKILPRLKLARYIKPAGYYTVKATRLKNFISFWMETYGGNIRKTKNIETAVLREQLLRVNGIGQETADSILLYALKRPVFVIDTYTKRILSRHGFINENAAYQDAQKLFVQNFKADVQLFNEYHALFVRLGKEFCLKRSPRCEQCPLHAKKQ